jgi:hypothetical protein
MKMPYASGWRGASSCSNDAAAVYWPLAVSVGL